MIIDPSCPTCHRRHFLRSAMLGSAAYFTTKGAFAEALQLQQTPWQTEGPFYPDKLPLDQDNDLIIINDSLTPAVGEVTQLTGTVRNVQGEAVRGALVEIWQVDCHGSYLHSQGISTEGKRDVNFQGYGKFETDTKGRYRFRTIKPVPYGSRTAHIHVAVSQKGKRMLTTQCYPKDLLKPDDFVIQRSGANKEQLKNIVIDFAPVPESKTGELRAHFDIIIGLTPEDPPERPGRKGRGGKEGRPNRERENKNFRPDLKNS